MAIVYQNTNTVHYDKSRRVVSPLPTKLLAQIATTVTAIVECPLEPRSEAHQRLPSLTNFIQQVYVKCRMTPTLLVVALVYLKRLRKKLPSGSQGEYDTPYKLYLASVVLASKFIEDSYPVARYVYRVCAPVYSASDITVMERSFLGVIKFSLFVNSDEITQLARDHGEPVISTHEQSL